jgi:glucose/arabinose dehydrogenase
MTRQISLKTHSFNVILIVLGLALASCAVPTAAAPASPATPVPSASQATTTGSPTTGRNLTQVPPIASSATNKPQIPPTATQPAALQWVQVVGGLLRPVGLVDAGGGRLLVLEQRGTIRVIQDGALLSTPFLDITNQVGSRGNEQGLLGIALHPDFKSNGYFFVNYTDLNGNTVIARFTVSSNHDQADPNSEKILLHVQQPFPNHNGGSMMFGPDGYLYMGLGDGGSERDPLLIGQKLSTLLGKLLRIDVDHGDPYAIPADNPFAKGGGLPEIWAYGLRNPWRFSFDQATGDLYIGDVGQDLYEEIDYLPAGTPGGTNFGWSYREGFHPYQGTPPSGLKLVDPIWEYSHAEGGCAVTGGFVYRGNAVPSLDGVYLFGDYCSGKVWGLQKDASGSWQNRMLFQTGLNISSFGEDQAGNLYLLDLRGGGVYELK